MRIVNAAIYLGLFLPYGYVMLNRTRHNKKADFIMELLKRYGYVFIILVFFNTISFTMTFQNQEDLAYIKREGYAGEESAVSILLKKGEKEQEHLLQVERRKLSKKQRDKRMKEAFQILEKSMLGENSSWSRIQTDLNFSLDQETYPFNVDFVPEDFLLVNGEGVVLNREEQYLTNGYLKGDMEKGMPTEVTVTLWYGEYSQKREYPMTIYPRQKTVTEQQFEKAVKVLEETEEKSIYKEGFELPAKVEDVEIILPEKSMLSSGNILVFGWIVAFLFFLREQEIKKQGEKKLSEKLRKSYPWFVNEMLLLLGAGMQVKHIFALMAAECEENMEPGDERIPLVKEIGRAKYAIDNGMSEEQAYYQLGRRLKLSCYIKLMTLLEQNVTKGTKGLTAIFETEEMAALEERKNMAKRYGEEAGTKLLGPMILLLLVVMLVIMIPAFMSFV